MPVVVFAVAWLKSKFIISNLLKRISARISEMMQRAKLIIFMRKSASEPSIEVELKSALL
jgi:hypothetical protein